MAISPGNPFAEREISSDNPFAEIPSLEPQTVTPQGEFEEYDALYHKSGLTRSQREKLNTPLREAMQVPLVSPERATRGLQALGEIGATDQEDLQPGPIEQGITEELGGALSGMTSGEGIASLPLYAFPGTAAPLIEPSVEEIPQQIQDVVDSAQGGTPKEVAANTTKALLNILTTAGVAHGASRAMGPKPGPWIAERPPMETLIKQQQASRLPPVVPPEYANRQFTMVPEPKPQVAPAPGLEQTLQTAEQAAPPVPPPVTQADITRGILDRRRELLGQRAILRQQADQARQMGPGGERHFENEIAKIDAQLNDPVANPVVHAPPEAAVRPPDLRTEGAQPLPQEARFPRGGPAKAPEAPPLRTESTEGAPEPSTEAAKYGGPEAAREALRQQVRRDQAARIKRRVQKDGGFVTKVTMEDIRNLGKEIYEHGMDFARWSAEMIRHLGDAVKEHLQAIWASIQATAPYRAWEEITGGRLRKPLDLSKPENFELVDRVVPAEIRRPSERGSVGRTGGPRKEFVSVDSNGERKTGEFDFNLKFVPKLLDTAPREEPNLFRTKNILGTGNDPKTVKGEKYGVTTYISYLSAAKGSGVADLCLFKTDECTAACLGKEGRGSMSNVKKGRIDKTKFFVYDPVTYLKQLDGEIVKAKAKAAKTGNELAIRLNGLSDVDWAKSGIMERHPDVQFYDYTKYPQTSRKNLPPNYHLTYSYTGLPGSEAFSKTWNDHGVNTAVVFANGMPAEFMGRPVIDGDVSDLRFLDPKGVIVGLHAKGAALKLVGQSKFIYDTPPEDVAIPYFDPRQKANILKGEFLGEEAIDAMKDLAPKAGDLKWKRGNPDLGLNEPGAKPELSPIQAFRERLRARREAIRGEGRQLSALGFDPEDTALQAAIGGTYIAEGVTDFARWSAAMVKEFGPDIEPHLGNLYKSAQAAHQQFQQSGQYTTKQQTPSTQDAPVGVRNETLQAREDAGLSTAPPPGIGVSWKDSVDRGNKALDAGADPYKIISDFNRDHLIGHPRLDPVRAWLERLQRANSEAHGALEADPTNPDLAREALRTQTAEDEFAAAYQPMKTEWSRSGTGMQEERGITDADLLSQKTAEQTMREHLDRELTDADKARAARAVKDTRQANVRTEAAFTEALDHAEKAATKPPMTPEQMKAHFAERIKQLTPC